jgi:phosphoribosylformimino-5-aminoimidazole carboxamide ribotide isomerase
VAVLIPSIDVMDGKIVQLVQGQKKALEFASFEPWIEKFSSYPLVQVIDLDAAMQKGNNRLLIEKISKELPCQVGGGIRSLEAAKAVIEAGAHSVILGSVLVRDNQPDTQIAESFFSTLGADRLVFAIDSRAGRVAVHGWQDQTGLTPFHMIQILEPWCSAFLYTHIDTEGMMQGIPLEIVRQLRSATQRRLFVAGGISSQREIEELNGLNVDSVVGMAIYTSRLNV